MDADIDCPLCGFDARFHGPAGDGTNDPCPDLDEMDPCLCGVPAHPDVMPDGSLKGSCGQYRPVSEYR